MILTEQTYKDKIKRLNKPYWNRSSEQRWLYFNEVIKLLEMLQSNNLFIYFLIFK